jgi:hypothetical protein
MKTTLTLAVLSAVLLAGALMLTGCKGDPGPQGPPGVGSDVFEGFAAGIQCAKCHNPDTDTTYFVIGRAYQWAQSKHATGGNSERNGTSCAGCHTTEGFIERMNGQAVTAQLNPSPPGCFACHSPHSRADFTLRKATAVTLTSNIDGVANATFDYGKGNICAQCHQPRSMTPKMPSDPGSTDTVTITSSRWYSHYGVQAQMLSGNGGYQFPGYTYTGNSNHTANEVIKQEGCPTCHMAEQSYPPGLGTGKGGGHTMNIAYIGEGGEEALLLTGCQQSGCHPATFAQADVEAVQQGIVDSLQVLHDELVNLGWIDLATELVNASTDVPLKITPAVKAGALYNYYFVEHDLSEGVHNTLYARELLHTSLEVLRNP